MEVIPSIDLKSGRCVRLYQGNYQQETVYSEDPLAVAIAWEEQGAPRLHLVDLDGAAEGTPANLAIISAIVSQLKIRVQLGGGIRDLATADTLLSAGVDRVVIGTAAVEQPALVQELCEIYGKQQVWTKHRMAPPMELPIRCARMRSLTEGGTINDSTPASFV